MPITPQQLNAEIAAVDAEAIAALNADVEKCLKLLWDGDAQTKVSVTVASNTHSRVVKSVKLMWEKDGWTVTEIDGDYRTGKCLIFSADANAAQNAADYYGK